MSWCQANKAGVHDPYTTRAGKQICVTCTQDLSELPPGVDRVRPRAGTQTAAVLEALEAGPVCSFEFYEKAGLTHRVAARVLDLKRKGYRITSKTCDVHTHKARAVLYELSPAKLSFR